MATFFLIIVYLAFISLGLPDSLLGAAWPIMHLDIKTSFSNAGIISMTIAGGTILSSLISGNILKRVSTGVVTLISCAMTATSLLGFYFAQSIMWLILLAVPLGLGAGTVDAALNSYVATHYKAHHMSWLHCFWGVGATAGPIIMSKYIANDNSWRNGYIVVSIIQFLLVFILLLTLPLWRLIKNEGINNDISLKQENISEKKTNKVKPLQIKGVKIALASFLFYCATESTVGLWGSSFAVNVKGLNAAKAAQWVSLYYAGITFGRFVTGFITMKVNNTTLIRTGQIIAFMGTLLLLLPLPTIYSLIGFIMVGLGCAPIYPCMLHETPSRFGKEESQMLMGYQMAFAYTGSTFFPPILGWIASILTIKILPYFVLICIILMMVASERINFQLYKKS